MLPRPKVKFSKKKNDKEIMCFFVDRLQFERCLASGCKLISKDNAHDASEYTLPVDLVASLATEVWRLDKRISVNEIERSVVDQMQRIKDIYRKYEIEVKDHSGDDYNDGMSIKVLHVEEVDGLPPGKMRVIETVKPSVYLKGKAIFLGEVIVGKSKEKAKKE